MVMNEGFIVSGHRYIQVTMADSSGVLRVQGWLLVNIVTGFSMEKLTRGSVGSGRQTY